MESIAVCCVLVVCCLEMVAAVALRGLLFAICVVVGFLLVMTCFSWNDSESKLHVQDYQDPLSAQ